MTNLKVTKSSHLAFTPILINRSFAFLWLGQTISVFGDAISATTIILWLVTQLLRHSPWAPFATGAIFIVNIIPVLGISPFAGVIVDSIDRRKIMMLADLCRATLYLLLAISAFYYIYLPNKIIIISIYITIIASGACSQFFNPSQIATISEFVPEQRQPQATGLNQVANSLATILGPPVATAIFFTLGAGWALFINATSFVASFLAVLSIRRILLTPRSNTSSLTGYWQLWREGLVFLSRNSTLRTTILAGVALTQVVSVVNTLDIFFVISNLHASTTVYGWLGTAAGFGVLVGTFAAISTVPKIGANNSLIVSVIGAGTIAILLSRSTSLPPVLGLLFLLGCCNALFGVAFMQLVYASTPIDRFGRVMSLIGPLLSITGLVAVGFSSFAASTLLRELHMTVLGFRIGPIDTIYSIAGIITIIGGLYALRISHENKQSEYES